MLAFFYSVFLKLSYPTSLAVLLLLVSAVLRCRARRLQVSGSGSQVSGLSPHPSEADLRPLNSERLARICQWAALVVLLTCGNGWVVKYSTRHLERECAGPDPLPTADCIVILSGGIYDATAPRSTVEVGESGDRTLYGAYLFKEGKAPLIICTGGVATGGVRDRPAAVDMQELLEFLGVSEEHVLVETAARNTHQHARNLKPIFESHDVKRVLLVTSALHMPRSLGVFQKAYPIIEFIPAPTDFRIVDQELPWYRELVALIPTPGNYVQFSETMHEYLGMAYYWVRGWM